MVSNFLPKGRHWQPETAQWFRGSVLQILLLPLYLLVLIGSEVTMDVGSLVSSVAMVLSVISCILNRWNSGE